MSSGIRLNACPSGFILTPSPNSRVGGFSRGIRSLPSNYADNNLAATRRNDPHVSRPWSHNFSFDDGGRHTTRVDSLQRPGNNAVVRGMTAGNSESLKPLTHASAELRPDLLRVGRHTLERMFGVPATVDAHTTVRGQVVNG